MNDPADGFRGVREAGPRHSCSWRRRHGSRRVVRASDGVTSATKVVTRHRAGQAVEAECPAAEVQCASGKIPCRWKPFPRPAGWHGGAYRVPPQAGASRGLELENTGELPCGTLRGLAQGAFSAFRARAELFRTVTLSRPRAWRGKVHSPRAIGGALWGRIPGTPQASPGTAQAHRRGQDPRCWAAPP